MRCGACDATLSNIESTRRHPITGNYLDLCTHCLGWVVFDRPDDGSMANYEEELVVAATTTEVESGDLAVGTNDEEREYIFPVGHGPDADEPDDSEPADPGVHYES